MPLKSGSSQKTVSGNIKEIVDDWEGDGTIGNSRPKTRQAAVKQAVAISLKKAGKSNKDAPSGKEKAGKAKSGAGTAKTTAAKKPGPKKTASAGKD